MTGIGGCKTNNDQFTEICFVLAQVIKLSKVLEIIKEFPKLKVLRLINSVLEIDCKTSLKNFKLLQRLECLEFHEFFNSSPPNILCSKFLKNINIPEREISRLEKKLIVTPVYDVKDLKVAAIKCAHCHDDSWPPDTDSNFCFRCKSCFCEDCSEIILNPNECCFLRNKRFCTGCATVSPKCDLCKKLVHKGGLSTCRSCKARFYLHNIRISKCGECHNDKPGIFCYRKCKNGKCGMKCGSCKAVFCRKCVDPSGKSRNWVMLCRNCLIT